MRNNRGWFVLVKVIVDLDACEGAAVCADVCPMNVYDINEMPDYNNEKKAIPTRGEECIMCMACVSACPAQAITIED
jgi:NAD-dependent dihydropyrimidine dehydrogenase PreA subunit